MMKLRNLDRETDPYILSLVFIYIYFWLRRGAQGEGMLCVRACVRACVCPCVRVSLSSNNEFKQHSKESRGALGQVSKQAGNQASKHASRQGAFSRSHGL